MKVISNQSEDQWQMERLIQLSQTESVQSSMSINSLACHSNPMKHFFPVFKVMATQLQRQQNDNYYQPSYHPEQSNCKKSNDRNTGLSAVIKANQVANRDAVLYWLNVVMILAWLTGISVLASVGKNILAQNFQISGSLGLLMLSHIGRRLLFYLNFNHSPPSGSLPCPSVEFSWFLKQFHFNWGQ